MSNAARLKGLQNWQDIKSKQSAVIANSLNESKTVTNSLNESKTVTKFIDSDSDNDDKVKELFAAEEDEGDDHGFIIKPEFTGKRGEKLMKLQARFGGDHRFKMDERFALEDGSEDSEESSGEEDSDKELKLERVGQKSIMESVLSDMGIFSKSHSKQKVQVIEDQVRFDPTNEDHSKFIIKHEEPVKKKEEDKEMEKEIREKDVLPPPVVSKETFFEVKTDFTKLMSTNEDTPKAPTFSFGFEIEKIEEKSLEEAEEMNIPELRYDSSEGEESGAEKRKMPKLKIDKPIFLYTAHPDGKWKDKIHFMRTEEMPEIEADWLSKREALTQEYKKRHRDAVRFQKKLKVKDR